MDNNEKKQTDSKPQQPKTLQQQDLEKLVSGFEENNLNLTDEGKEDQGEEDAETMAKIKEEYAKFMKEMELQGEVHNNDKEMNNLGKAFQDLLKGLTDDDKTGQQIGKKFDEMFKNLDNPQNFQNAASQLLNEFMDKSLLEQPLKQTKQNYEKFFQDEKAKNKQVTPAHKQQYQIIKSLLNVLDKTPNDKQKMIQLFNKLQTQGNPPPGIAPSFGFF